LIENEKITALHESAHAVIARRLDVPVSCLSLGDPHGRDSLSGYTCCDWKEPRARLNNDLCLCRNAFAIAYAGAVFEKEVLGDDSALSGITREESTDFKLIACIKECLVQWLGFSAGETQVVEDDGRKLACKLVPEEMARIKRLAQALLDQKRLDENAIRNWFINDEHRVIRERAYFHWENKSGKRWWDSMSNWIEAEEQETLCRQAKPACCEHEEFI
jgi:hypothetical protein